MIYLLLLLFPVLALQAKTVEEVFTKVYERGEWGKGEDGYGTSGGGSLPGNIGTYNEFLQDFLKTHNIKSVVDLGCGDFQIAKQINWDGISYTGIDAVKRVIENDNKKYGKKNIKFICANILNIKLPEADLLICKDVLQHLTNKDIAKFLHSVKGFKYCLITNDIAYDGKQFNMNGIIKRGQWRMLDLSLPPFNVINATPVLTFKSENSYFEAKDNTKQTLLFTEPPKFN